MIKELYNFLIWKWQSFQTWQKMFLAAMAIQTLGWFVPGTIGMILAGLGIAVVFGYMLKWFVWDELRNSWAKYKAERNSLLTTIKNSDHE